MAETPIPPKAQDAKLAEAKAKLIRTAAEVDPLAPMRAHPWATVTTAAAIGAAAAAGAGRGTSWVEDFIPLVHSTAAIARTLLRVLDHAWSPGRPAGHAGPPDKPAQQFSVGARKQQQ